MSSKSTRIDPQPMISY